MLKRNDLCSCGSGKKYKNCCLDKDEKQRRQSLRNRNLDSKKEYADKIYTESIIKLSKGLEELVNSNKFLQEAEEKCHKAFFGDLEVNNTASTRFFASYFSYDYLIDEDNTPAILALKTMSFSDVERSVIGSCINSYPSLFTIEDINDKEVIIKDIFSNREYYTLDAKLLGGFKKGEFLIGRPVRINDIYILTDLTIRIQEETKDVIYKGIMDAFNENKESLSNIEYFVSINSLYFYKYMLQLLKISDYMENTESDGKEKENNDIEIEHVEINTNPHISTIMKESVSDEKELEDMMKLWNEAEASLNVTGSHNGWAAGLEYYYRKSNGESVTQNEIAKNYGVSASTLAKRNKEISNVLVK